MVRSALHRTTTLIIIFVVIVVVVVVAVVIYIVVFGVWRWFRVARTIHIESGISSVATRWLVVIEATTVPTIIVTRTVVAVVVTTSALTMVGAAMTRRMSLSIRVHQVSDVQRFGV